ncbi:hypothetical protein TREES_T100000734 [Tupaia chinensis]|uniref:Uncharacterized protein n=1 Tax=Tupaia chinensis TaxID=246437 RepID=L9KJ65_TUPCH|nr:hypothetical protein TREES_T100000734 [Tupaia chinensis]
MAWPWERVSTPGKQTTAGLELRGAGPGALPTGLFIYMLVQPKAAWPASSLWHRAQRVHMTNVSDVELTPAALPLGPLSANFSIFKTEFRYHLGDALSDTGRTESSYVILASAHPLFGAVASQRKFPVGAQDMVDI